MRDKGIWKISVISIVLAIVVSCVMPGIAVNSTNTSNRPDVDLTEIALDYEVTFNMSSTCIIGTDLVVKGESTGGSTVDIAFDNIMVAIDLPIEDGKFSKIFPTPDTYGTGLPGSIKIKAYVDGPKDRYGEPVNVSVGEEIPEGLGIADDGSTIVLMTMPYLTANHSSDLVQIGDSYTINGTAPGSKYVNAIMISPKGGYGVGIDGGYGVTLYNLSVSKEDYTFSKAITVDEKVSENGDYTKYITMVLSPGRDRFFGSGNVNLTDLISSGIFDLKNRSQVLDILKDRTIYRAGSDDLMVEISFCVGSLEEKEFKPFQGNLTAKQVSDVVALGDNYRVSGTCYGSDHVDLVVISPHGGEGIGIDGAKPGYVIYNLSVEDNGFSKRTPVDENADTGCYIAMVLSTGINKIYDGIETGDLVEGLSSKYGDLAHRNQNQLLSIIMDATIDEAGSDDILWIATVKIETPYVHLYPIESVSIGEILEVTGGTNREEGTPIFITVEGPVELTPQIAIVEDGTFSAEFDTSDAVVGAYWVTADDGDGHTDTISFELLPPPQVFYVPDNYSTIQEAVNAANAGDVIVVRDGTYAENINVNKRLTIKSENGSANCIVQAASSNDHIFDVRVDYVNINGFTVRGATGSEYAGIYLGSYVYHCNISDNIATNNYYGIHLYYSSNINITNNTANNNDQYGIRLYYSSNNNITNNTANDDHRGFGLLYSHNNNVANNIANLNKGVVGMGIGLWASHRNDITNNIANLNERYGIYLQYSTYNIIRDNTANDNDHAGIGLQVSSNNNIIENTVNDDTRGICLEMSSNDNILTNNTALNNDYGIYFGCLQDPTNSNIIYLNNFIDNTNNAYSYDLSNIWSSASKITYTYKGETHENYMGNYWSDYTGKDGDTDGIGDTPYSIDSDKDNYPLMEPFENYFAPTPTPPPASGKGIWIWHLSEAENGNVSKIIERCENVGIVWVAIKCGDGGYFWSQCKLSTIEQFQNAGIKVFGWQYVYGDDPIGEASVANQILDLGVDGFIIDAEGEYEGKPDKATIYLENIREEHPDSSIAYTTFPIIDYHTDFPYLEFGKYCDAVMPQDYWEEIGVTPEEMIDWMEEQWDKWHEIWEEGGYEDSVKPIIPLGQGWDVSGSEITRFCNLIYDHGYSGVSLWRYGTMTEENWEAYAECFAPPAVVFDTGSGTYPSIMGTHTGTIKPTHTVIATKMYTYPCTGTGGHTKYAEIRNATWSATATWEGYAGDWKNITFDKTVVLLANETYNYTIRTGSYPQIHHTCNLSTPTGFITCTEFVDANGKRYDNWILAIRLW